MNRINDYAELESRIVSWIREYADNNGINALVVGVSGGIDSAVVSTLCARTRIPTFVLTMPLASKMDNTILSTSHAQYLRETYSNVVMQNVELSSTYEQLLKSIDWWTDMHGGEKGTYTSNQLANANTKSRLRMVTLYQVAGSVGGIVVGTGNKVEDYGIGFYTKYGDGGVDIAPIADLYKTEVWELGRHLGVDQRIIDAAPTDGLWEDSRTDEAQVGASYEDLEWVMESNIFIHESNPESATMWMGKELTENQKSAIKQYGKFNRQNKHKMISIPTFKL
jgi:NAD+ synthase